ncbi:hypothetical protein [Streptomyces silvisoli]|uniref:Uncharacterized protein n=1 Tax=Streptomyces silvisoli TaxID=3034235 RepID=A0ABT5ZKF6_9ACTN|nr:hypothetical protein [Streptomyces silvisoli]MDF3290310.1 hypothetical protein [Streptomyces silvisoli]
MTTYRNRGDQTHSARQNEMRRDTGMLTELAHYSVEWNDLHKAHEQNSRFLRRLAADREGMRTLFDRVREDPTLWDMCEHNRLFDKLVLHDAPERGFRLRLHRWFDDEVAAAHDHRWSFTTLVLRGGYDHTLFEVLRAPDGNKTSGPDERVQVAERFRTTERAGDSYTIQHTTVHSTATSPQTVTLLLRGPAEKPRSRRTDPSTGQIWYGVGRQDQTAGEVAKRQLSIDQYERIHEELAAYGIV